MFRRIFAFVAVAALAALPASADVVLTFDSGLEGFADGTDGTVAHSAVNGGSMAITAAGGWAGNSAAFGGLQSNAVLWAEIQAILTNGGTISYDLIVNESDVTYTAAPTWFETVMIVNAAGGWDSETHFHGLGSSAWPLAGGVYTGTTTTNVLAADAAANDGNTQFGAATTWANLHFGLNNQGGGAISTATVHIDNLTFSAVTAVPEPGALGLLAIAGVGLISRRRR